MDRYTIVNNAYSGSSITYSTCEPPKLTSTTLNTNEITWDKLVTRTRHTTSIDTIPGTTSTTRVDTTQTYKCEMYTYTTTTMVNKDEYMSFYINRNLATYVPSNYVASDGYQNRIYTDSYTAIISDSLPSEHISISVQNAYFNKSTASHSDSWSWTATMLGYSYTTTSWIERLPIPSGPYGVIQYVEIPRFSGGYVAYKYNTTLSNSSSTVYTDSQSYHELGVSSMYLSLRTASQNNTATFRFTTSKDGCPTMSVVVNNSTINTVVLTNQNFNLASSLFYLGTMNVNLTTRVSGEREVR